jgi:pimeloyl-ACP methyl ester carboxylesterase
MEKLLLLHGAIGSKEQLTPLAEMLKDQFQVYRVNFSGHGGGEVPSRAFSIELFAEDILKWMDSNGLSTINIFGYSMGGYVALYLAKNYPERINKVFTFATKFTWNEDAAKKETKMLDPGKIAEKIPVFAETLMKRHHPVDWKIVLKQTAEMMMELGRKNPLMSEDYESVDQEVMIGVGDNDNMVSIEETVAVYRKLKKGKLIVMPDTVHPIEKIAVAKLAREIKEFFQSR